MNNASVVSGPVRLGATSEKSEAWMPKKSLWQPVLRWYFFRTLREFRYRTTLDRCLGFFVFSFFVRVTVTLGLFRREFIRLNELECQWFQFAWLIGSIWNNWWIFEQTIYWNFQYHCYFLNDFLFSRRLFN